MAATAPKKRKVSRKNEKQYSIVKFELPQFDGEFQLPDLKHLPLRVMTALNKGDLEVLIDWLREAKVHDDYLEALLDLGQDEVRSEEHTSELQSRGHLVCRLLHEKKKSYHK